MPILTAKKGAANVSSNKQLRIDHIYLIPLLPKKTQEHSP